MPRKSLEVRVNPAILKWARESAGWTVEEISEKLKAKAESVQEWETGEKPLTLKTLERLATYFKRPLAAFFLPEPPVEPSLPNDFRMLPGKAGSFSKETRLAVRRARRLQAISGELIESLGLDARAKITGARVYDDPEKVARGERQRLGVDIDKQLGWKDPSEAFKVWRDRIESLNIMVFQIEMPIEDARGFSLTEKEPPAIVVNKDDAVHAKIFTLFHEYGHVVLQEPGICIPEHGLPNRDKAGQIETWCHRFTGALLLPEKILRRDEDFLTISRSTESSSELLEKVSRRFKVSRQAILIRMRTLELISEKRCREEIENLPPQLQREQIKPIAGFRRNLARECLQEKGRLLVSLVMESKERELITYGDVADYLSLQLKHFGKLESLVREPV